ncbi:MAG: zf-HC2 domain-containing protein [Proteobacteria bacterium]|nr:zf-HC2 domain-containing protein [Pseudomonadota bacterium]
MAGPDTTSFPPNPQPGADRRGAGSERHADIEQSFSDYYEGLLPDREREAMAAHLAGCEACRAGYEQFKSAVTALSELHKMTAPPSFDSTVEDTIRRRSGGRFFGRKAFGDRVPFELLAVVVLVIGLAIWLLLRSSSTGSLRYQDEPEQPAFAPGARDVVPQPAPLEQ